MAKAIDTAALMDMRVWGVWRLRFGYLLHRLLRPYWLVPLWIAVGYCIRYYRGPVYVFPSSWKWMPYAQIGILALVVVLTAVWILFSRWHGVSFRELAFRTSRGVGAFRRWFRGGWVPAMLWFAIAASVIWLRSLALGVKHKPADFLAATVVLKVTALVFFVLLISEAVKARRRLVVAKFTDYTGDAEFTRAADGLSDRLQSELAKLSVLYQVIDEFSGASQKSAKPEPIIAVAAVEDAGQFLQTAVSSESKISLGPLQVPIGSILALVSRLVQGPRLGGSLHREGGRTVIIGRIIGGGLRGNWRVESDASQTVPPQTMMGALIGELACRIFTDLVSVGSPKWAAVSAYTSGLAAYRETLRTERDRVLHLRQAESAFIRALAEDNDFGQCYYNVGIVYRDLGEDDSAEFAFRKAILKKPVLPDPYYALTLIHWAKGENRRVLLQCDRMLSLQPADGRAWNLKGLALRRLAEAEDKAGVSGKWKYVLECSEIATAMAWRALCRSAWTGKIDEKALDTARTCSRNLAFVCNVTGETHFRLRLRIYRQAIRLATNDSSLHRYLATEYSERKRSRAAILEFEHATRLFPSAANWLALSQQYASNGRKQEAKDAIEEASNLAWGVELTTIGEIEKQADILGVKASEASLYKLHLELDKEHSPKPKETEEECATRLEARLQNEAPTIRGRLRVRIGELLWSRDPQKAKQYLQQGIEELEKAVPVSDRHPFFHELLSNAYSLSGDHEQALIRATRAVALEPLHAHWRQVLANVLLALEDYEKAEKEWRTAHDLAPSDPGPLRGIAQSYWNRGVYFPQQRGAAFKRVVEFFQDELSILEQQPMTEGGSKKNIEQRALVHHWLGRFYTELNRYDDAVSHLKISLALGFKPLETRVALGEAYLASCSNNEAEDFFAAAIRTARALRRSVGRLDRPADANGEDRPIAECLMYSHAGLATSFADRNIRLQNARRHVHYAARYLKHVGKSEQVMLLALERDIRGWVRLRTDPLDSQHIADAITELQCSLALRADPQSHYHLAEGYLAHALAHPLARASSLSKARENSVLARQLDSRGTLQKRLDGLVARIDAASAA